MTAFLFCSLLLVCAAVAISGLKDEKEEKTIPIIAEKSYDSVNIIIDAGHGGTDGGTSAEDGTLEKNINLEIAKTLNSVLKAMGFRTRMIRTTDVSIYDKGLNTIRSQKNSDLKNRLKIAEKTENAIFISIHQNYYQSQSVSGTQVFYSGNNPLSKQLAEKIKESVQSHLQPENKREIKQSGSEIYILNNITVPAVMVECGFLSNTEEKNLLCNEYYQRQISFCIAAGLIDYLEDV